MGKNKTSRATHGDLHTDRYEELRKILEDRRREILSEVQDKIKDVRAEGASGMMQGVAEPGETATADIQDDIEFALIQMKAETLQKINEALARLEEGAYGNCFECGEEISPKRLRALPFAVRCKDCEEARETAARNERVAAQRRGSSSLFLDMAS
jgi:DnaK suppressor protein